MKITFFLVAILIAGSAFCQNVFPLPKKQSPFDFKRVDVQKLKLLYAPKNLERSFPGATILPQPEDLKIIPMAKGLQILANGNKVYALSQDNMPCIVPDKNATVAMPNVNGKPIIPYRYKGPGAIPNPSVPILINPKKKITK